MSDFSFQSWKSENPHSWFSCVPGKNGFLPVGDPLDVLPDEYNKFKLITDFPVREIQKGKYAFRPKMMLMTLEH